MVHMDIAITRSSSHFLLALERLRMFSKLLYLGANKELQQLGEYPGKCNRDEYKFEYKAHV